MKNNFRNNDDVYYKEFNMISNDSIIIGNSTGNACTLKYALENKIKIDKKSLETKLKKMKNLIDSNDK